jgi:hypothetical protein
MIPQPSEEEIEAREHEGYMAFFKHKNINQNPYWRDHEAIKRAWDRGWRKARRETVREEED